jgi:hypothetical protein
MSDYVPHNYRPGEKAIAFFLLLLIIFAMCGCSPEIRAYKKLERAKKIAPDLFQLDTVRELLIATPPRAKFDFDCLELKQGDLNIEVPREYVFDGKVVRDTVFVTLSEEGSSIDCPPVEKEIVYQDVPVPVEKPLTDWQKFKIAVPYILGTIIIMAMILLFVWLARKFFNITSIIK